MRRTSVEKVEAEIAQAAGSGISAGMMLVARQMFTIPEDPAELDLLLVAYAQRLLSLRSDDAEPAAVCDSDGAPIPDLLEGAPQ